MVKNTHTPQIYSYNDFPCQSRTYVAQQGNIRFVSVIDWVQDTREIPVSVNQGFTHSGLKVMSPLHYSIHKMPLGHSMVLSSVQSLKFLTFSRHISLALLPV